MISRTLKAWMPRSLYGRGALILLVPVATILIVVSVVVIQRLYEDVTRQMTEGVAEQLGLILDRVQRASDAEVALLAARAIGDPLNIDVFLAEMPEADSRLWYDVSGRVVARTLREELPLVEVVDLASVDGGVVVYATSRHGTIAMDLSRRRVSARNPHQFLVLIGFTSMLMTVIGLLYLRGQVRPIRRLARAAEAFGKGRSVPYRPSGATEVRQAGTAFLAMRARIERQIEQRTRMLSGVSHDLRTPLTRMRLQLSLMEGEPGVEDMERDVREMEEMIDAFLAFARGDSIGEPERTDPEAFLRELVERYDAGVLFDEARGEGTAMMRPRALRRAIDNLISNALRYAGEAHVSLDIAERRVRFIIEDSGPGIPPHLREEALKAFSRLDGSRNQDSGSGVGLGLSIANDIAQRHGGRLILDESPRHGGLRAVLEIPR